MLAAWDVHAMPRYGAAYLELAPRGALPLAGLAAETGGAAPELGITMLRRQTMIGGRSNRRVVINAGPAINGMPSGTTPKSSANRRGFSAAG